MKRSNKRGRQRGTSPATAIQIIIVQGDLNLFVLNQMINIPIP